MGINSARTSAGSYNIFYYIVHHMNIMTKVRVYRMESCGKSWDVYTGRCGIRRAIIPKNRRIYEIEDIVW